MKDVEDRIHSAFASIAASMGYSEVHGRIIAVLLTDGRQLSLDEIAKKTGYSLASISLSLDMLELIGAVKKIKKSGDRKLYVRLEGDLLEVLKKAFMLKLQKEVYSTLYEFEEHKKTKDEKTQKAIEILEKEVKRLEKYVDELAKIDVPK